MRRVEEAPLEAAKQLGGRLYAGVFDEEIASCLESSLVEAGAQGAGLRLRFSNAPELLDLP